MYSKEISIQEIEEKAIAVKGLTKRFGDFVAVDHISFDVARGEIFGFLGANGAGKTTAMRMLCGLSRPTAGSGRVAGCNLLTKAEEIKRRIGYMSQKFSLYENLTVQENLRLFATIYGMSKREFKDAAERLYDILDLYPVKRTLARDMPTGWRQKLSFAAATIHSPEIVFLDEPTGGVDPISRRKFWELIYRVSSEGMTVFVTTHYLDEAEYCGRVSIMVDGKIKALDTPEALKERYDAANMTQVFLTVARDATRSE